MHIISIRTQMIYIYYIYKNPQNDRKSESSLIKWGYTNFYNPIFDHGAEWICQCPAWAASEQGWAQMLCWAPALPSLGFWNFTKKWGFHGILFAKPKSEGQNWGKMRGHVYFMEDFVMPRQDDIWIVSKWGIHPQTNPYSEFQHWDFAKTTKG